MIWNLVIIRRSYPYDFHWFLQLHVLQRTSERQVAAKTLEQRTYIILAVIFIVKVSTVHRLAIHQTVDVSQDRSEVQVVSFSRCRLHATSRARRTLRLCALLVCYKHILRLIHKMTTFSTSLIPV